MKQTIGLMMVVRNEAERIRECLEYHLPYVDEVAICDQSSDDGTFAILERLRRSCPIKFSLISDKNWGYCEPSKQTTADLLSTDWILYIDPDEQFPKQFLEVMHEMVKDKDFNGYNFYRRNIFKVQVFDDNVPIEPKWLEVEHPKKDSQLRLTRKSVSLFPTFLHHRVRITGRAYTTMFPILHRKTVSEQWQDNERYVLINKRGKNG